MLIFLKKITHDLYQKISKILIFPFLKIITGIDGIVMASLKKIIFIPIFVFGKIKTVFRFLTTPIINYFKKKFARYNEGKTSVIKNSKK